MFNHGAIEIESDKSGAFKVNGHRLKHFNYANPIGEKEKVHLDDPQSQ